MGGGGQGGALGRQVQPPCSRSPVWPVSCSSRGLGWCLSSHNRICLACPGHLRAAWAVSVHASAGPALGAFRTQGLTTLWAACVLVCVSSVSGLSASRAHSCIPLHTAELCLPGSLVFLTTGSPQAELSLCLSLVCRLIHRLQRPGYVVPGRALASRPWWELDTTACTCAAGAGAGGRRSTLWPAYSCCSPMLEPAYSCSHTSV